MKERNKSELHFNIAVFLSCPVTEGAEGAEGVRTPSMFANI
jgi:hypothetical protein